jgi:SAM-dependent methyltransferase
MGAVARNRPLWRRAASWARRGVYRAVTPLDRLMHWHTRALLPPAYLRAYYYGTFNPDAFARACDNARRELIHQGLRPEHRVLDIGSGIGNLAIGLRDYLHGGYDGLEIHPDAVAWCQRAITPRYPAFRFHRADLTSRAYNPRGRQSSAAYCFPFPDQSFDFVLLYSVFTHMLPADFEQYVREISRVLARDGEAAVALEETFVHEVHQRVGLRFRTIRRGGWWHGDGRHHDVLAAVPDRAAPAQSPHNFRLP